MYRHGWGDLVYRLRYNWKFVFCIMVPIMLTPVLNGFYRHPNDEDDKKFKTAYVIALMAFFWVFEVAPMAITALFPLFLFPLLGIQKSCEVSKNYMKESNMIFLGSIIIALSIEYSGLHIRGALKVIGIFGARPDRIMFGVMTFTAALSMWLSDTSCTTMMLPILMAIVSVMFQEDQTDDLEDDEDDDGQPRRQSIDLGLAPKTVNFRARRQSTVFANSAMSNGPPLSQIRRRSKQSADGPSLDLPQQKQRTPAVSSLPGLPPGFPPPPPAGFGGGAGGHGGPGGRGNSAVRFSASNGGFIMNDEIIEESEEEENDSDNDSDNSKNQGDEEEAKEKKRRASENIKSTLSEIVTHHKKRNSHLGIIFGGGRDTPSPAGDKNKEKMSIKTIKDSDNDNDDDDNEGKDKGKTLNRADSVANPLMDAKVQENIRKMMLLACAYSANIGGTGSLVGTGPIKVFKELNKPHEDKHAPFVRVSFTTWMAFTIPPLIINICIVWAYLTWRYYGLSNLWNKTSVFNSKKEKEKVKNFLAKQRGKMGPITAHEIAVLVIFVLVVFLWLFRDPQLFPGWASLLNTEKTGDSTAAMFAVLLLFMLPKRWDFINFRKAFIAPHKYEALLDWKFICSNAPWGYILLIGSGYAIADAAEQSGLSEYIGREFTLLEGLSKPVLLLVVIIITSILTEVVSNTACATLILPILFSVSCSLQIHPSYLTMAAAISGSYAFMLPISSPPNAIVFATGELTSQEMFVNGFILNLMCTTVLYLSYITYGELIFQFSKNHHIVCGAEAILC